MGSIPEDSRSVAPLKISFSGCFCATPDSLVWIIVFRIYGDVEIIGFIVDEGYFDDGFELYAKEADVFLDG